MLGSAPVQKSTDRAGESWQDAATVPLSEDMLGLAPAAESRPRTAGSWREAATRSLPKITVGVAPALGEGASGQGPGRADLGDGAADDEVGELLDPAVSVATQDPPAGPAMDVSVGPVESRDGAPPPVRPSMEVFRSDLPRSDPDEMAWSEIGTHTVVTDLPSTFRWGWVIGVFVVAAISVAGLLLWGLHRPEGHANEASHAVLAPDGSAPTARKTNGDASGSRHDARPLKAPDASQGRVKLSKTQFRHVLSMAWKAARSHHWSKPEGDNLVGYLAVLDAQKRGTRSVRRLRRYAHARLLRKAARALKRGDLAAVEVAYRNMLAINPGNKSVKWSLVRILLRRSRRLLERKPKTASVLAGEAVVLVGTASARLTWADALAASGHVNQAIGEYQKVTLSRGVPRSLRRRASKALAKMKKTIQRAGPARARPRS